ncbi:hypothetical protein V8E55_001708 [Tylopilus felleus]
MMSIPHIPQDLRHGHGVRGGRASNGAFVFLEVPYALPPARFTDPRPLPGVYRYENKDYVYETKWTPQILIDRYGLGEPSEDPLFVNIVPPTSFTRDSKFPVKIYIHGGFLQRGFPHGLVIQAQYPLKKVHACSRYHPSLHRDRRSWGRERDIPRMP